MTVRLDFSIGPVQGFVAQSRRTRDLWASSYLLAFLSAHAMRGAENAGGKVVQPAIEYDPLYAWVSGKRNGQAPRFGSLPNHFVVEVSDGQQEAMAIAQCATEALQNAWRRVCNAVWDKYVAQACAQGDDTQGIWNRQVSTYWGIVWTVGEADALARRKHWRNHQPLSESGDKCTLMHNLQELSGYVRAHNRQRQDAFWDSIRRQRGHGAYLDLRDNERLCAIAFVKRFFPLVSREALGYKIDKQHWRSTLEFGSGIPEDEGGSPYFALVLADGDRLGRLLGEGKVEVETVSRCLADFTTQVPNILPTKNKGVLVYAGGDDVLALLQVENALPFAHALAKAYQEAFSDTEVRDEATLSAAVVIAHGKLPLSYVLRTARRLLDGEAKDANGRNSVCVAVLKNSGPYCQWTTSWSRICRGDGAPVSAVAQIESLFEILKADSEQAGLSSSLLYRLRDLVSRLCGWERWQPGNWGMLDKDIDLRTFLEAEIAHSLGARLNGGTASQAQDASEVIWRAMSRSRSPTTENAAAYVGVDALMLAHFLAHPEDNE